MIYVVCYVVPDVEDIFPCSRRAVTQSKHQDLVGDSRTRTARGFSFLLYLIKQTQICQGSGWDRTCGPRTASTIHTGRQSHFISASNCESFFLRWKTSSLCFHWDQCSSSSSAPAQILRFSGGRRFSLGVLHRRPTEGGENHIQLMRKRRKRFPFHFM